MGDTSVNYQWGFLQTKNQLKIAKIRDTNIETGFLGCYRNMSLNKQPGTFNYQ